MADLIAPELELRENGRTVGTDTRATGGGTFADAPLTVGRTAIIASGSKGGRLI